MLLSTYNYYKTWAVFPVLRSASLSLSYAPQFVPPHSPARVYFMHTVYEVTFLMHFWKTHTCDSHLWLTSIGEHSSRSQCAVLSLLREM